MDRPICCNKPMMRNGTTGGTVKEPDKRDMQIWKCSVCKRTKNLPIAPLHGAIVDSQIKKEG